jgi:hypothetical protein
VQKKVNAQNGKVSKLFSITANGNLLPNKSQEKDNLIKLIQIFLKIRFRKRIHVFDNTMSPLGKLFKGKDSVISDLKDTRKITPHDKILGHM